LGLNNPLARRSLSQLIGLPVNTVAGYFTPGIVFKVGPKVTGYAGYSIGNTNASNGNHFFLLEVGYNFN
jgi:hypothetical protein